MFGLVNHSYRVPRLNYVPLIKDKNTIANLVGCTQIVRDVQKGNPLLVTHLEHNIQNGCS